MFFGTQLPLSVVSVALLIALVAGIFPVAVQAGDSIQGTPMKPHGAISIRGEPPGQLTAGNSFTVPPARHSSGEHSTRKSSSSRSSVSDINWRDGSISQQAPSRPAKPTALEIPGLRISAVVRESGLDDNGNMVIPEGRNVVGWYRYGPRPGEPGTTVIAGHLDDRNGKSVFYDLSRISEGDDILLAGEDGLENRYRVVRIERHRADDLPLEELFARLGDPVLALVTCAGRFDWTARRYLVSLIVFAEPV